MGERPASHQEDPAKEVGFIEGKIEDENKKPLEGVRVMTNDSATYTDEQGRFVIGDKVCLNPHLLITYLDGYQVYREEIPIVARETKSVMVTLASIPGCVSGVITDYITGAPVAGATVCLLDSPSLPCTTSAADGSYMLCDYQAPVGCYYSMKATKENYKDKNLAVKIPSTKNFKMTPKQ
jgi:hypothetical protein